MRIGRIGNVGAASYIPSAEKIPSATEKPQQEKQQRLPGWEKSDSYTPSKNQDGRVTPTGAYDYLSSFAANAARFDNFDL